MGARFDIKHLNILGYLTDYKLFEPPRIPYETMELFLMSFENGRESWGFTELISDNKYWAENVIQISNNTLRALRRNFDHREILSSYAVGEILHDLKSIFIRYPFYACIYGSSYESERFFRRIAVETKDLAMIMFPEGYDDTSEFIDPTPLVNSLSNSPVKLSLIHI